MARHEQDREDLIAEAKALIHRAEVTVPDSTQPLVLGLRSNLWFSIYFDPELVFHFNEVGALRRAFIDGLIYRSGAQGLTRLRRSRSDLNASELLRQDLSAREVREFLQDLEGRLGVLRDHLRQGRAVVLREVVGPGDSPPAWERLVAQAIPARLAGQVGSR
jgi:hypothetical protein